MRKFWERDLPVGDPNRGAPYGERLDPGTLGMASQVAGIAGTAMNFMGTKNAGRAARGVGDARRKEALFEAQQLRQNAGQTVATSQRTGYAAEFEAKQIASRAAAVAAAGGGAVTDPTIANIIGDITGRGSYNKATAMYQGEERARQMNLSADAKQYEGEIDSEGGRMQEDAANIRAYGGLATGASSLFMKYGQGGSKVPTADDLTGGRSPIGTGWDA